MAVAGVVVLVLIFVLVAVIASSINHSGQTFEFIAILMGGFLLINFSLAAVLNRLNRAIASSAIDAAFVGIGENGHLAFNDPPADFATEVPYIVVQLDDACRRQQFGEGWFKTLDDVPRRAISMTVRQIMKAAHIICTVPEKRKARAVKACLEGEIGPMFPASILRTHPSCHLFLDKESAGLLRPATLAG